MRLVAFSDVHGLWDKLTVPDGDVLIFAGDFMTTGYKYGQVFKFGEWFSSHPHKRKIWIAGNHDRLMEKWPAIANGWFPGCDYLIDSGMSVAGVRFWGSPYTPEFNDWAFNVPSHVNASPIETHWNKIPDATDVLITHGPGLGCLDGFKDLLLSPDTFHVGCPRLREAVLRVKPQVHIFGHIHCGYGNKWIGDDTRAFNVAVCDENYLIAHPCTVIDL